MATLNIKNFPDDLYRRLQKLAEQEHRSIAQQVVHTLDRATDREKKHSILEFKGIAKGLWEGADAAEYVRRERDSWD